MTVYRMPSVRPYQRRFRIFSWSAIAVLLAITLFAIYEPQGVSRSTNIALAIFMGAIVIVAIVYGTALSSKEALWKLKHSFQWELTEDKIIQNRANHETIEISLNAIAALREFNGWLFVSGTESQKGIMISQDVDGYDEVRRQLIARCPLTPTKKANPLAAIIAAVVLATLFGFVIVSHVPAIVIGSGLGLVLLWPAFVGYTLRPFWRAKSVRTRLLITYLLSWLILVWIVFRAVKALI
jgi:hypothetical protein